MAGRSEWIFSEIFDKVGSSEIVNILPSRFSDAAKNRIRITISHFEGLRALTRTTHRPAFHLKLDTGMHRQGFQERELPELLRTLNASLDLSSGRRLRVTPEGIYSHYAMPDNAAFSRSQRSAFERCLALLRNAGIRPKFVHMSSTGSIMHNRGGRGDTLVRAGLGLYGYLPAGYKLQAKSQKLWLRPVMTWKTIVAEVKRVRKGERIGYDLTERLKRDSTVAILPVGYWHGFDRGLSSVGEVLIRGRRAKVLGRVSMDMIAIDITEVDREIKKHPASSGTKIKNGEEIVIIGRQGRDFIGADEIAAKIGTTAYEVLTRINPLIKKIIA